MKKFMIVSTDGSTQDNFGFDSDNAQVVAFIDAESKEEAMKKYIGNADLIMLDDDNENTEPQYPFSPDSLTVYEIKE